MWLVVRADSSGIPSPFLHRDFLKCKQNPTFDFQEWGKSCPPFVAAYKLEHDMTFTPYDKIAKREDDDKIIDKILRTNSNQLSLTFN